MHIQLKFLILYYFFKNKSVSQLLYVSRYVSSFKKLVGYPCVAAAHNNIYVNFLLKRS
jgi:hypothetical protein